MAWLDFEAEGHVVSTLSAVESQIAEFQDGFALAVANSKSRPIVSALPEAIDLGHPLADANAPQGVAGTHRIAR